MTSRTWRIQDGLPDQVVQAIAQGPDHYLWLGTKTGLVRFDGYHFLEFGSGSAPVLRDFGVDCILVARDNSLWIGTQGGGVVHLLSGGSRTYGFSEGMDSGLVRALYEDAAGRIWAGTDHGLFYMDPRQNNTRFIRVRNKLHIPDLSVHAIVGDGEGGVWVGGSRLLHFFDDGPPEGSSWEEVKLQDQPASVRIWTMALAADKTLWVGTLAGLLSKPPDKPPVREKRIPGGTLSLHIDDQQRLWVGTLGEGLFIMNGDGSVSHAVTGGELSSNAVLAMAEDEGHDLWVGTQSGLTRFSNTGMHITRIPGAVDADFGSVAVDSDRSLWVCSRELIHLHGDKIETVALPSLQGITIRSVMRERSGAFWVGTLGNGAYRMPKSGPAEHYTREIGTNYIRSFLETKNDGVWIASDGGVANYRDGQMKSFQNAAGSPHAPVIAIAPGASGELWVGTYQGLSLLSHGVYQVPSVAAALGNRMIWALHRSDDGTLWIGTESGLYRWHNGQLTHLRLREEMGGSAVLSILEDSKGRMWLGGRTSVLRTQRSALEYLTENPASRSLFAPEIFEVSRETGTELSGGSSAVAELDGEGGAWFASHDGPVHIQSAGIITIGTPPPLILRQVSVDGQRIKIDGPVVLQPSAKTLEIDATPISFSARPGLQLRRRLIGFDSEWLPATSLQPATYTSLPAGKYTYRVEASWRGSPGVTVLELPIIQQTHFYRRPIFLIFCAALALSLTWLIHELRVRQMALRFRLTAEERSRMAREIHDTVVQGCIGVSSLLEAIAIRHAKAPQPEGDGLLNTAREQIALTIVEARDAIWNLRQPQQGGGLAHSFRAMLDRMTASRNTIVSFDCEGEPILLERATEHELLMAVREALHNAMTHGSPSHISLTLQYGNDRLTVHIRDDGRGFSPGEQHADHGLHVGLIGMQERMERVGGSCTIESVPGRGAEVTLALPLRSGRPRQQEIR